VFVPLRRHGAVRWLRDFMSLPDYLRAMLIVDLICSFGIGLVMPIELLFTTHTLGASMSQATLTVTLSSIGSLLCNPIIGWFSDKHSPWFAMHIALVFSVIGPVLFAFSNSFATALLAAFISGMGMSMMTAWTSILTLISDEEHHNIVYGINQAELNLGVGLGAAVGGLIAAAGSDFLYRVGFTVRGIGFAFVSITLLVIEKHYHLRDLTNRNMALTHTVHLSDTKVETATHNQTVTGFSSKAIVTMGLLAAGTLFMDIFGYSQFDAGLVTTLISNENIPRWSLSLVDVVNTFAVVIMSIILLPRLKNRNHILMLRTVPIFWSAAWIIIDAALMLNSTYTALSLASFGMIIFGLGEVMLGISQPVVAAKLAGPHFSGRMFGVLNTAQSMGYILGPLFSSFILDGREVLPLLSMCAIGLLIFALPWLFGISSKQVAS
jgi:MFS family permease